jgi:hypothetical protein
MRKRIIVHIGLPKTGSSALQALLSRNAEALERIGISYPNPENAQSEVHSGNLMYVMLNMATVDRVIHAKPELLRAYLVQVANAAIDASACQTVLLSGEFFSNWKSSEIVEWFKHLDSRHSVTIIAFVRDIYDRTVSAWKQGIKTSSTSADFGAFVKSRVLNRKDTALHNVAMLADSAFDLRLINYDYHKGELFDALLREIGVQAGGVDLYRGENRLFNPSISYRQAKIISLVSQSASLSKLSALLLNQFKTSVDLRKDPVFSEIDQSLLDYFSSELHLLNRLLPEGEKLRVVPKPADFHNESCMFAAVDLSQLFESFEKLLAKSSASTASIPHQKSHELPTDFDAEEYLLLNPDVAEAGMDPIYHYLNHGRFEFRSYKGQEMPRGTVALAERVPGSKVATPAGLHFDFLGSREFGHKDDFFHFMLGYLLPALDIALSADAPRRVCFEDCGPLMNATLSQACALLGLEFVDVATRLDKVLVPRWDRFLLRLDGSRPPEALGIAFLSATREIRSRLIQEALMSVADRETSAPWLEADVLVFRRSPEHAFYTQGGGVRHPVYGAGRRQLCNATEITQALIDAGIHASEIDLDAIPFAEQIAAIHRAKGVVGACGAEFAHLIWMRPSSAALMFATPIASPNHVTRTLASVLDLRLMEIDVEADQFDGPVQMIVMWALEAGLRSGGERT